MQQILNFLKLNAPTTDDADKLQQVGSESIFSSVPSSTPSACRTPPPKGPPYRLETFWRVSCRMFEYNGKLVLCPSDHRMG